MVLVLGFFVMLFELFLAEWLKKRSFFGDRTYGEFFTVIFYPLFAGFIEDRIPVCVLLVWDVEGFHSLWLVFR